MSKSSTTRAVEPGPTLRELIDAAGLKVVDAASKGRMGASTIYRAFDGEMPSDLHVWALSVVLAKTESEVRASIKRSKGAA